jgi:hypothetical protein
VARPRRRSTARERRAAVRRAGGAATPAPAPAPVRQAVARAPVRPAVRLPYRPSNRDLALAAVVGACGLVGLVGYLDRFGFLKRNPALPLALALVGLGALFLFEHEQVVRYPRASLRFAGFGLVGPALFALLGAGAPGPICALQAATAWRLGRGSVFPPTACGTLLTGAMFGPTAGLLAFAGFGLAGVGALLTSREPAP